MKAALGEPVAPLGNQTNNHSAVHYIRCTWEKKQQLGSTARDRGGGQYQSHFFPHFLWNEACPQPQAHASFPFTSPCLGTPSIHPLILPKTEKSCTGCAFSQVFLREDTLPYHLMFMILCNWTENMQIILLANAKYGTTKSSTNNSSAPGHRFGKTVNYYTLGL